MLVLGFDPGTNICGYGLVKKRRDKLELIEYGVIRTKDKRSHLRLKEIYQEAINIIDEHKPEVVVVEEIFFSKNTKTALKVGEARGVILLAATNRNISTFEYTPLQIKQAVTGYGNAKKSQVKYMVKALLGLDKAPTPDDAADALAAAICHLQSYKYNKKVAEGYI